MKLNEFQKEENAGGGIRTLEPLRDRTLNPAPLSTRQPPLMKFTKYAFEICGLAEIKLPIYLNMVNNNEIVIKLIPLLIPVFFSFHQVLVRKGSEQMSALDGTYMSLLTSTLIFSPSVLLYCTINFKFIAIMLLSGLLHFLLARLCFYHAIERIGANLSAPLSATRIFFATIIGYFLLNEVITVKLIIMSLLIFSGILLLSNPKKNSSDFIGISLALLTGLLSAISSYLVKIGLMEVYNPLFGVFLGFLISTIVLTLLMKPDLDIRRGKYYAIAGVFVGLGHLARYISLQVLPVSYVEPITSIYPFFTVLLSFLLIRESEVFSKNLFAGMVLIVLGTNIYFLI